MFNKTYTFDDVALVPQYNTINSRLDTDLSTKLTKKIHVQNPLIPANMDTVISFQLAQHVIHQGGIPIFHRFCDLEIQIDFCKKFKNKCFVSCGTSTEEINKLEILFYNGALGVCIDIAHGHSKIIIDLIRSLKNKYPTKQIIAGNICTSLAYHDLVIAGADAVKIGIGPGAACTTRIVTGFGVPQFSAIYNISKYRETLSNHLQVPIIADGGIRNSRDVALAIAAGADTVMIGNLFSKTLESASPKYTIDQSNNIIKLETIKQIYDNYNFKNKIMCHYRGQASKNFQNEYYGKIKSGIVAEGIDYYTESNGYVDQLYNQLNGGLRSALTYSGSSNINEFHKNAEFIEVTSNYMSESKPRDKQ